MSDRPSGGQVALAQDHSALEILHRLLLDAVTTFPEPFTKLQLPEDAKIFRKQYPEILPRFEAARLASVERNPIDRHMVTALQPYIIWQDASVTRPLAEALRDAAAPAPLTMHAFDGAPGWAPNIVYRGERWDAAGLAELGALLKGRGVITTEAANAFAWLADEALDEGVLRMAGRKIAVLGGGAEMAPTRLWLEAGADVLWLDTQPPPPSWWETPGMSGRLFWPAENTDLLANPQQVLATIIDFAEGKPVDIGLYAYAPGQAREMRLTAAMNAIVDALPEQLVGSVTMLVSPTTPTQLSAADLALVDKRIQGRLAWEALCAGLGLLGKGRGYANQGDAYATRTVVSIQGASYQAAQYVGKILMAQCWSAYGQLQTLHPQPLRVSANTAAITRTRSMAHPVFAAAFGGAAAFGVETMTPRQSRRINGLLAVHDWLNPVLPRPGQVRVHGGIHTLPYPLEPALKVAAAIGFARSPRLLRGLMTR